MEQTTKITLAWQLHQNGTSNSQIARDLSLNRETVNRWIAAIKERGLLPFLETYRTGPRKSRPSRQIPVWVKQKVWFSRDREGGCCGHKIGLHPLM